MYQAIVFLPLIGFLIAGLFGRSIGAKGSELITSGLMVIVALLSWVAFFSVAMGSGEAFTVPLLSFITSGNLDVSWAIRVDTLTVVMLIVVNTVSALVHIYSIGYMHHDPHRPRFFAYLSLFTFAMLMLVTSDNLVQMFFGWEGVGLASYLLIGFWFKKPSANAAAMKAFIVNRVGDFGFLLGIFGVYMLFGSVNFSTIFANAATYLPAEGAEAGEPVLTFLGYALDKGGALTAICLLLFMGAMGKSAQVPLHTWLPDAMEGPTPVSALIHAATMVAAGIYLVGRLFNLFMLDLMAGYFVAFVGAFTALIAALIALVQNDIKKVLAYSTISQLGFMLGALGSGAYTAGLFHLFTHAFFKALLFLGSGAVIVACHSNDIWTMGGLKKHLKFTHGAFVMGCLALAGFPLFSGFWSKDEILAGAFGRYPEIFGMLCFAAFLTAFYVTRMYCIAFLGEYRGDENKGPFAGMVPSPDLPAPIACSKDTLGMEPEWTEEKADPNLNPPRCLGAKQEHVPHHHGPPHEVSSTMYGPLLVLAVFAVFLGFVGIPEHNLFHHLIQHYREPAHEFHLWLMGVSVLIALSGIGLGWSFFAKDPIAGEERLRKLLGGFHTTLSQKFYMDHFWAWAVSITMMTFSKVAAWFDDDIIDGGVRGTGVMTAVLGEKIRKEHSGLISHYLFMLIASVLLLAMLLGGINPDFVLSPQRILEFNDSFPTRGITE